MADNQRSFGCHPHKKIGNFQVMICFKHFQKELFNSGSISIKTPMFRLKASDYDFQASGFAFQATTRQRRSDKSQDNPAMLSATQ